MLKQLTFTRFIAAVAIVIYHYGIHVRPFTGSILRTLFSNAYIGVSYFFILSGFVMVIAYGNKSKLDVKEYYIHRVARIYPVYIIALLLTAAISLSHGINWKEFVLGATVTQAWVPKYALSLNIPGWSLSVEYLFYLLFPFLLANIYKKSNFAIVTIVILVIWLSTQTLMNFLFYSPFYKGYPSVSHNILFYFPLMRLNEFLIGNLTGLIFIKYKPRQKNYDLHLITLSTLLLIIIIAISRYNIKLNYGDGAMAIVFAPFILILALNNGRITKLFSHPFLIFLGEISFSIYILQFPIGLIVNYINKILKITQPELLFYGFVVSLIGASCISYYMVEVPARNWIKNLYEKRKVKATSIS